MSAGALFAPPHIVLAYGDAPHSDFPACCSLGANAAAKSAYRPANAIQTGGINRAQARGSEDGAGGRRETARACP